MPVLLNNIKRQLKQFGRNPNNYDRYSVNSVKVTAMKGIRAIAFKGIVNGSTGKYSVHIQFFKIQFSDEPRQGFVEVTLANREKVYYKPPSSRSNPVKVKCSCDDFRFRFEKQLFDDAGLIGNWRRYRRKTPPRVRPTNPENPNPIGHDFMNPDDFLGFCKHLWSFLLYLRREGMIKN